MAPNGVEGEQVKRNRRYRVSAGIAELETDLLVLTDAGEHAFRINGRAMSEHDTIRVEDMAGSVLCEAPARIASQQTHVAIGDGAGNKLGSVVRRPISPLRDRFAIEIEEGPLLSVEGNVATYEYSLFGVTGRVAEVSRRWFQARGSYGIEIQPGQDDALLLTSVVVLDRMVRGEA